MDKYPLCLKYLLLSLIVVLLSSCNQTEKNAIAVIKKVHGNAKELQKVLDHYRAIGATQKYNAACFLIANMGNKKTQTHNTVEPIFRSAKEVTALKGKNISRERLDLMVKVKTDSLISVNGFPHSNQYQLRFDIQVISSEFLIKNIDLAFKVWEMPWARHVGFDDFCEYILPYRIHNEPLSNWREEFFYRFISFADSVENQSDPKQLTEKISNYIYQNWTHLDNFNSFNCFPSLINMEQINGGTCDHRYFLVTAIMRSIGLPVCIEYTPQWTNYTGGHAWNALLDIDGRMRPFNGGEDNFRFFEKNLIPMGEGGSICTKVFREVYSYQKESLVSQSKIKPQVKYFENPCLIDVTGNYDFYKTELTIDISDDNLKDQIIYLATFNYGWDINIVAWAKVKNGKADFGFVGLPAFYIPVFYQLGQPIMIHKPLVMYIDKEKRHIYNPQFSANGKVALYRKFNFSGEFLKFANDLIGSRIQGGQDSEFIDAIDLDTIRFRARGYEELNFENTKSYRYLRLLSKDSSDICLAELEFWGTNKVTGETKLLTGNPIGFSASGVKNQDIDIRNAFDNSIRTNFNAVGGSWIGLDLGAEADNWIINNVWFLPRNNLNVIEEGHIYELFYLSDKWVSLGKQRAGKHRIYYNNVPKDAILLLKNHSEGKQERIFMYDFEKQEQIWW